MDRIIQLNYSLFFICILVISLKFNFVFAVKEDSPPYTSEDFNHSDDTPSTMRTYSKENPFVTCRHAFHDVTISTADSSISNLGDSLFQNDDDVCSVHIESHSSASTPGDGTFDLTPMKHSHDIESMASSPSIKDRYNFENSFFSNIVTSTPMKKGHDSSFLSNIMNLTPVKPSPGSENSNQELNFDVDSDFCSEISYKMDSSTYSEISLSDVDPCTFHQVRGSIPTPTSQHKQLQVQCSKIKVSTIIKHIQTSKISSIIKQECCRYNCLNHFEVQDVKELTRKYWSKTSQQRHEWLLDILSRDLRRPKHLTDIGISVCTKAFISVYGINKSVFYRIRKKFMHGIRFGKDSRAKQRSSAYLHAMNWLEDYSALHGDRMPDSGKCLLPYRTKKGTLYNQYKDETEGDHLAKSTFYKMWDESFPSLRIKEVNSFSQCTICATINRRLEHEGSSTMKREKYLKLRQEHNTRQMLERKYYYKKRKAATDSPLEFLSLIIDGMDQSKTNLPHFVGRMAKSVLSVDQLSTHVTGVLAHGQNKFYTFLDYCQYPHDSNLTMNILLMVLQKITRILNGHLPPVLYLQADNCWRENKNKYVMSFCELLVRMKIFKEVHLSFLIVGHTHEDVDAAFSRIAKDLNQKDAETISALLEILPSPTEMLWIYDIRTWLEPYISDIRKHTKPLHYKFSFDVSNQCLTGI